jgi:hypothetical protein
VPAETHTHVDGDGVGFDTLVAFVASLVGVEPDDARTVSLAEVGFDDGLAALHLWAAVVDEFGERCVGEFESPEPAPQTVADLAAAFLEALSS